MADQTLIESAEALADDMRKAHRPIYMIAAQLAGANALLEKAESLPDPDGVIWSAAELVRHTQIVVDEMMAGLDVVASRAERAERATTA